MGEGQICTTCREFKLLSEFEDNNLRCCVCVECVPNENMDKLDKFVTQQFNELRIKAESEEVDFKLTVDDILQTEGKVRQDRY
uniref:Uncharacterized protein n=1 Tax=Pithovirus LCPAC401 TaxID=2506595 RepID=A0A481Z916_9VIRU|nr:MAG: hypothetical protein LCPAC401_00220 [Pithovirus LCPAC401]